MEKGELAAYFLNKNFGFIQSLYQLWKYNVLKKYYN